MNKTPDALETIRNREDLAHFLDELCNDFRTNPKQWSNGTLSSFLEALAAWAHDMDGYYDNARKPVPKFLNGKR